ncbi:protein kinase [Streptomyces sp. NBC_01795]|uniref:serine/threonine-protein kinase n=1 Tax=Streptomyces sp. NBC_01795 TaxID=2975943 RepID=UPI002DD90604|nr:protein kinase [Streptomyces sp. NBC_01795]WSA92904.1 protein kinase [Streptomyces sp. NBC_01795]
MDGVIAGRYRIGERLGRGGMGTVWRAHDELLGRHVAVKELHLEDGHSPEETRRLRERTLREARTVAQVGHPNILVLHDVVEQDERPWIVMELVEGRSLAELIAAEGPVTPQEAARIGLALLGALRAAHRVGILHRDIKPANVLLEDGSGRVVLTDFGIARVAGLTTISDTGSLFGSPEYMAPERLAEERTGPACDLWSLGVLLCAAVEGKTPFHRESATSVVHAVALGEIRLPPSADGLRPVILGLLERSPERRMDADDAEALLRAYAEDGVMPQTPPGSAEPKEPADGERQEPAGGEWREPVGGEPKEPAGGEPKGPVGRAGGAGPSSARKSGAAAAGPSVPHPPTAPSVPHAAPSAGDFRADDAPAEAASLPPGTPRGGSRSVLVAALLVAALAGGGVAGGVVLSSRDSGAAADAGEKRGGPRQQGGERSGPGSRKPGPGPEADNDEEGSKKPAPSGLPEGAGDAERTVPGAPAGYRTVEDPLGFRMTVPKGFTRSLEPPRVFYYSPGKRFRIGVHIQDQEAGGALGVMREAHQEAPARYPGYRDAAVGARAHGRFPGARWEFTWNGAASDGGSRHTYDQSWDEAGKLYDVWVSSPLPETAAGKRYFDKALKTFERAPTR